MERARAVGGYALGMFLRLFYKIPVGVREYAAKFIGSRKWLLALGVTAVLLSFRQWDAAVTVVVAYISVQGGSDALVSWMSSKSEVANDGAGETLPSVPGGD